ncbi:MAG TPA: 2-oxoglutarate dehydrogenase complex dihydrolipoyllysine-residue succinyltransferase [Desulfatirhabdiaceae bacterium]|nr:2-oxoglutarate dehydrogenase complex dihydrolipoyllysine-residue succinyltransferase [Desulfatirhabdiaceae bacterium]
MAVEIRIPAVGESVREAVLAQWMKQNGDEVHRGDPILVIETDKVTLEITAEADGILTIQVDAGVTVPVGSVVGLIQAQSDTPVTGKNKQPVDTPEAPKESSQPSPGIQTPASSKPQPETDMLVGPAVRRLINAHHLNPSDLIGSGPAGRITKGDILLHLENQTPSAPAPHKTELEPATVTSLATNESVIRKPMSPIRKRIAERLLEARRNTAMLTTFNEIDMTRVMAIRKQHQDTFKKKHGTSLGMMSFFIKACVSALKEIPEINAAIDGETIVYHQACHIGIAVGSDRGLVVPVIRNAENQSFADLEKTIVDFVERIRAGKLTLAELEGGTFTISNGGVYGSLLSTPILNTPQSGILGMHKIEKRPVVIDDSIVIRPMMYVALSYDHRIVDGQGAVTFLKRVKECIEDPERMMVEV